MNIKDADPESGRPNEEIEDPALFKTLVDNAPDGFLIVAFPENRPLYANQAWYDMFGFDYETQDVRDVDFSSIAGPEAKALEAEIHAGLQQDGTWSGETLYRRQDGTLFPVVNTLFLVENAQGVPTHVVSYQRDLTETKRAEAERERLQQEVIDAQQRALREMSTPIIPVVEGIIVMPLVGHIDTQRARDITRALLAGISEYRAKVVILDITGVSVIDTGIAQHLDKTVQAARLKGTRTIITGISDAVAETVVDLGIDWRDTDTLRDLQTGLIFAIRGLGIELEA